MIVSVMTAMAERLLAILTLLTVSTVMATIRISNDSRRLLFSRFDDECQIPFCYLEIYT